MGILLEKFQSSPKARRQKVLQGFGSCQPLLITGGFELFEDSQAFFLGKTSPFGVHQDPFVFSEVVGKTTNVFNLLLNVVGRAVYKVVLQTISHDVEAGVPQQFFLEYIAIADFVANCPKHSTQNGVHRRRVTQKEQSRATSREFAAFHDEGIIVDTEGIEAEMVEPPGLDRIIGLQITVGTS